MKHNSTQACALHQISSALLLVLDQMDKNTFEYDTIELIATYAGDQANKATINKKKSLVKNCDK